MEKNIRINTLSNIVGSILNAILGIVFVPIFIKYIGTEGYGLMGIFASIQTVLYLLDMGLSTTLNRVLAQQSINFDQNKQKMMDTTRTFEYVFWGFAGLSAIIAIVASYFLAMYWVNPSTLSRETVFYNFILLSFSFAFMLPRALYYGGLLGLQKHLIMNIVNVGGAVIKNLGAVAVLIWVESSTNAFFEWQVIASIIQTGLMAFALWYFLPKGFLKAKFDAEILRGNKNFALGVTGISITAIILTQVDKVILSKILSLEDFGYYTFATLIGSGLMQIVGAIYQTYFPRFSQLFAKKDTLELSKTYHQASRFMALAIVPFAVLIAFFSDSILTIWTNNNTNLVQNSYIILSILILSTALNGLMNIPYALYLAAGSTKTIVKFNVFLIVFLIPLMTLSALSYGSIGAALVLLSINLIYLFGLLPLIHRRFLTTEMREWIIKDTLPTVFISCGICSVGMWLMSTEMPLILRGCFIGLIFLGACMASAWVSFPLVSLFKSNK